MKIRSSQIRTARGLSAESAYFSDACHCVRRPVDRDGVGVGVLMHNLFTPVLSEIGPARWPSPEKST